MSDPTFSATDIPAVPGDKDEKLVNSEILLFEKLPHAWTLNKNGRNGRSKWIQFDLI